jgi:hypothetical protein
MLWRGAEDVRSRCQSESHLSIAPAATCGRASAAVPAVAVCALLMKLVPADQDFGWNGGKATGRGRMQSVIVSVAVGLLAFVMGLVGLNLKRRLPERHMSTGSRDMDALWGSSASCSPWRSESWSGPRMSD